MRQYLELLKETLKDGDPRIDRTGVGTIAIFAKTKEYDMGDGFPIITTKKIVFNSIKAELLWFLSGSSDVRELQKLGSHIWDQNAISSYWEPYAAFVGDLGRTYGVQWRRWKTVDGREIDQIDRAIRLIKNNPYSRRILVSTWNPGELDAFEQYPPATALCPCHGYFEFFVARGKLSVMMVQRSADMFLGVPFNISSYALLLHMVAQVTGLKPFRLIHVTGDTHIYFDHFEQVRQQLKRDPYPLPKLVLNPNIKNIDDFRMDDIDIKGYQHHPFMRANMAI
jgi:thymidylate synthase